MEKKKKKRRKERQHKTNWGTKTNGVKKGEAEKTKRKKKDKNSTQLASGLITRR